MKENVRDWQNRQKKIENDRKRQRKTERKDIDVKERQRLTRKGKIRHSKL